MIVFRKRSLGFTLTVEVMLGMSVLGLVILALFNLFPSAERSVAKADRVTQANHLARKILENHLALPYDNLVPGVTDASMSLQNTLRRGARATTVFAYRVEVAQPDPTKEVKDVTVSVKWERDGGLDDQGPQVVVSSSKGRFW